jgi:hypothetical protein
MTRSAGEDTQITVTITGSSDREAPATWGQLHMFEVVTALVPHDGYLNPCAVMATPAGTTLADLTAAITMVVATHESLRTSFTSDNGGLRQQVAADQHQVIDIITVSRGGLAAEEPFFNPFRLASFELGRAPLVRFAVGCENGIPHSLAIAASHMVMDGWSLGIVVRDLSDALEGLPPSAARWHPVDQAKWEAAPAGCRQHRRARLYRTARPTAPTTDTFKSGPRRRPAIPRYWIGRLTCPTAFRAMPARAAELGISVPSLLIAAYGRELSSAFAADSPTIMVYSASRFLPQTVRSVGQYAQCAPLDLPSVRLEFAEYARIVHARALLAYRNCMCGPSTDTDTTPSSRPTLAVNILPDQLQNSEPTPARARRFDWVERREQETLAAYGQSFGAAEALLLMGDTAWLDVDHIRTALFNVEEVMLGASTI